MRVLFLAVGVAAALLANPLSALERLNTTVKYLLPGEEKKLYLMTEEGELWLSEESTPHLNSIEEGDEIMIYAGNSTARLIDESNNRVTRLLRAGTSDLEERVLTHQIPCTKKTTALSIGDALWLSQSEIRYQYWEDPELIAPISQEWVAGDTLLIAKTDEYHANAIHIERREVCPLIGLKEKGFMTVEVNKLLDYTFSDGSTWSVFPNTYSRCETWKANDELYTACDDFRKLARVLEVDAQQLLSALGDPGWGSTYNRQVMLCFNPRNRTLAFFWQ